MHEESLLLSGGFYCGSGLSFILVFMNCGLDFVTVADQEDVDPASFVSFFSVGFVDRFHYLCLLCCSEVSCDYE